MVLLAELEIFHSRPIAPTRRLALGRHRLPCEHHAHPGAGGLLLGAICARFGSELSDDFMAGLVGLTYEIEQHGSVPQPRLRHRLQQDRIGLTRTVQRLYSRGDRLVPVLDGSRATPRQLVLAAVYAAGTIGPSRRSGVTRALRRGLAWHGDVGDALMDYLAERDSSRAPTAWSISDPIGWARSQLGLGQNGHSITQAAIQRGFREAVRAAHPDLGAPEPEAASRIADLSEARRILLSHDVPAGAP